MTSAGSIELPHVAVATDAAYLPWCATVVRSCFDQHPDGVHVHVLHEAGVPVAGMERLPVIADGSNGTIDLIGVDCSRLEGLARKPRFGGYTALLRLLLPDILPDLRRVIYVDIDTLVVDSLQPLWQADLEGEPLAAVTNVVEPAMLGHLESLGIHDLRGCFNSGVLVIDMEMVRAERSFDATIDALATIANAPWFDQDALNVVFAERWRHLHPRWNAMNSLWKWPRLSTDTFGEQAVREATSSPGVVHFEGPAVVKPWHYLCTHPWRDRYRQTLARTPWAGTPLHGRTAVARLIHSLPPAWRLPAYTTLLRAKRRIAEARS